MTPYTIVQCTFEKHANAILDIFNEAIAHSTALFDYQPRLGSQLMHALIGEARQQGLHAMIGGIDAANAGSIALHQRLGFTHVGTLPQVGFKFGRWLDLAFYQRLFDTPTSPVEG
ncbi:MAG: hypothetical protein LZF86_120018 [Nitrospira sp.]|nr:MAG: hypothetical protein LZF86_120018 [Nitrospira sp.]